MRNAAQMGGVFLLFSVSYPIEQFRQREADIARDDMYSSVLRFPTLK